MIFIIMVLIISGSLSAVDLGKGSYTTTLPSGQKRPSNRIGLNAEPQKAPGFNKPVVTNKWWTSLLWRFNPENTGENLFADPLSCHAYGNGLSVGYSDVATVYPEIQQPRGYKSQEYHFEHKEDLRLSVVNLAGAAITVADYSDWAVTAQWVDTGNRGMIATIGHGFPFVYVDKVHGTAQVQCAGTPQVWYTAQEVVAFTVNGHHYALFAPTGSTWQVRNNRFESTLQGKQFYTLALLPDNQRATVELYKNHAYAFVTNTTVEWRYDQSQAVIQASFYVQTELKENGEQRVNHPLLATYRHQWLHMNQQPTVYTYSSPHGVMKVIDSPLLEVVYPVQGLLPYLPLAAQQGLQGYTAQQLYGYIDDIFKQSYNERWQGQIIGETYSVGKMLNRISQLIPLALAVGHVQAHQLFLTEVKQKLQQWLSADAPTLFYYDKVWNTLIGYPASYGSNTSLNDHHFHYGYFIHAAAIVAHYDKQWAQQSEWGSMINLLIKDIANSDRSDTQFPFLRNFDAYAGHSWASGAAEFAAGNNQESSSEALHCAAGIALWGIETRDDALRDLGLLWYTTESEAVKQYWFDVDNVTFPDNFNKPTLGMIWGNGGGYVVFWEATAQEVHGINFLPITPASLHLADYPEYLRFNQQAMIAQGGDNNVWQDIHMQVQSLYDPLAAIARFNRGYNPEAGESRAHTYAWIHTINALGQIDTSVRANTPCYRVFNKNGTKTYCAYNSTAQARTVTFTDGMQVLVPGYQMILVTGTQSPTGPSGNTGSSGNTGPSNNTGTITGLTGPSSTGVNNPDYNYVVTPLTDGSLQIEFNSLINSRFVDVHYKINNGPQLNYRMQQRGNGPWQITVPLLKMNDQIIYYFTYEKNGLAIDTPKQTFVYQLKPTQPFTQSYAQNTVTFTPQWVTKFVDIHYRINNGPQQNVRMSNTNNVFTYPLTLRAGDKLAYYFTYERNGLAYDTQLFYV